MAVPCELPLLDKTASVPLECRMPPPHRAMALEATQLPLNIVHQGDGVIDCKGARINWNDVPRWGHPMVELHPFCSDMG